jgi:hypothetical protein
MPVTNIPYDFIRERVCLGWPDVSYALEQQLIAPKVAIEKATERLCEANSASDDEVELAGLSESDSIMEIVLRLAKAGNASTEEDVRAKWLYIVLGWLFENRESVNDALGVVEEVYSDFGYPREVALFVRYMPMVGPDLGNREQNEARLYVYWKNYIDEASKRFGRSAPAK